MTTPQASTAAKLATGLAVPAVTLYAGAAAAYEIVRLLDVSLVVLGWLTLALWVLGLAGLAWLWARAAGRTLRPAETGTDAAAGGDARVTAGLAALMLVGALLAIVAFRPDADDSYYLANVTFAVANPAAPITDAIRGLASGPLETFRSSHWATAVGYDYLSGSLGHLTGIDHLHIRYFALAGLAGAVLVAGCFLLLTRVCPDDRAALAATIAVVALYVVWREAHRDPGNFAFPRIYQGKAVVMTALAPLYAAWLWAFLRRPSGLLAGLMVALTFGAAGMTASAVFILAGIGVGVTVAALAERPRLAAPTLRNAAIAALCGLPLVIPAIHVVTDPLPLGPDSPANQGWPTTVIGHMRLMGLSTWALLVATVTVVAVLTRGPARRAVLAWTAAVLVVFLNPVTGQILLDAAIGPNAFWRMSYVLPWVPLAGLAALAVVDRLPSGIATHRAAIFTAGLIAAIPAMIAFDALRGQPTPAWPPTWKLDQDTQTEALAVIDAAPTGPMLAPLAVSRQIPILDATHPQLRLRTYGLRVWAQHAGAPELADRRILATAALSGAPTPGAEIGDAAYLGGPETAGPEAQLAALRAVLDESRPTSVVLRHDAPLADRVAEALRTAGYTPHSDTDIHAIWTLAETGT